MISPYLLSLFIVFGGGGGEKDFLTFRFFGEQLLPFFFFTLQITLLRHINEGAHQC